MMGTLLLVIAITFVTASSFAQGVLNFNNRNLTGPNGTTYNAPISGFSPQATAQLLLVTGSAASPRYTPLFPLQSFRPPPNSQYFLGPLTVTVPGHPLGTSGLSFVVRVWDGPSYDAATLKAQSAVFTVGPLVGRTVGGQPFLPPDLGGPEGMGGLQGFSIPEPSTISLALLAAASLLLRSGKDSTHSDK
jgi:hypothetical protein